MAFVVNHVHLKTRDPAATARFYMENFGATLKAEIPDTRLQSRSARAATERHRPDRGAKARAALRHRAYRGEHRRLSRHAGEAESNGVKILEELPREIGRHVCFLEAPDGAQMEVIEKV